MNQDNRPLDDRNHGILPSIKPDADEVSSYRKSGRSDAPKQSSFNGILVFVLFLMVIVMGFGGYVLYEVQKKLVEANELLSKSQDSILELEGRLAATGTDVSKTLQEMQGQAETNVGEIDKLWAVAYRQNRPKIESLAQDLENSTTAFRAQLDPIASAVAGFTGNLDTLNKSLIEIESGLVAGSEEQATTIALLNQRLQDQTDLAETHRRSVDVLSKQLKEARSDIRSNLEYRARHNTEVLEMKRQIQALSAQRMDSPNPQP